MNQDVAASDPFDKTSRRQLSPLRNGGAETAVRTNRGLGKASAFRSTEVREGERGSRDEMQRLRAEPEVPVVVGMEEGEGPWA
jgi:hypothetical protein